MPGPQDIESVRRFKLSEKFISQFSDKQVPWGPLGYVTYKRTYARPLDDGSGLSEEWYQTCRRVIEGMFTIQKRWVYSLGLEWNDTKAQRTAKETYDRMFYLKWTPAGRGLWQMGTDFVEKRGIGAGLFSCAFVSTKDIDIKGAYLFRWMMDALMLGLGVGFDTLGVSKIMLHEPAWSDSTYVIADSREGWCSSIEILLNGFFFGKEVPQFDFSQIRKAGEPIRGFGGVSAGPQPLIDLHTGLRQVYESRAGEAITVSDIVDTENLIGRCVVSGNVRRSAAIALGSPDDMEFMQLKNDVEKLRSHRWSSNNSIVANVGMDYAWVAEQMQRNGEPGIVWLENCRAYGRMKDGVNYKDRAVMGVNACSEQPLCSMEVCLLAETFPARHDSYEDYQATLKVAYLYAKTLTLVSTHWPETNAIMLKNRRIGLSQSGIIQAFNKFGRRTMLRWCDNGYTYLKELDAIYSDWLCVPRSVKLSTTKPAGTTSLLCGATPGIHYPEAEYYIRRIRFAADSALLVQLQAHGYKCEPDRATPNTIVVEFPVHEDFYYDRSKADVSIWEQLENVAQYQHYWSDNSISVTVTFKPEEAKDIQRGLELYETRLKSVSFLRYVETGYEQAPLEPITKEQYEDMTQHIVPFTSMAGQICEAGVGEKYCTNESCML